MLKSLSFFPQEWTAAKLSTAESNMQKALYWGDLSDIYKIDGLNKGKRMEAISNI